MMTENFVEKRRFLDDVTIQIIKIDLIFNLYNSKKFKSFELFHKIF